MCSLMACGLRNGGGSPELTDTAHDSSWAGLRTGRAAVSLVFLLASLAGVVLLAKMLAPALDEMIELAGLPQEFTGVVIAALVLAPESIAAVRASLSNRPQTSINLALGSALASIALTIPVITLIAAFTEVQLVLGVPPAKVALLVRCGSS